MANANIGMIINAINAIKAIFVCIPLSGDKNEATGAIFSNASVIATPIIVSITMALKNPIEKSHLKIFLQTNKIVDIKVPIIEIPSDAMP
jgi:hypothetical protein